MTIQQATEIIKNLHSQTSNNSEIKIYEKFIHILNRLKTKTLSEDELESLETKLKLLNLDSNPKHAKKYFKKKLNEFEAYLKTTFSFTTKKHYTTIGGGLGLSFGILFGVIFLSRFERSTGITFGMLIGMVIGTLIGHTMDTKAESENRTL